MSFARRAHRAGHEISLPNLSSMTQNRVHVKRATTVLNPLERRCHQG